MCLVIAVGHVVHHFNFIDPLDPPVAGPTRNHEAKRRSVNVLQIFTVVGPGQDGVRVHCLLNGKAFIEVDDAGIEHLEIGARS